MTNRDIKPENLLSLARAAQAKASGPYVVEWTDPDRDDAQGHERGVNYIRDANGDAVITADSGVYEPGGVLAEFFAAASPDVVAALCERVEALEAALRQSVDLGRELLAETDSDDEDFGLLAAEFTALRALAEP